MQTELEGTNYVLEYQESNLILRNKGNQNSVTIIRGYSPVAASPVYSVLRLSNYGNFLITRLASGGNSGGSWYSVFKLSPTPVDLTLRNVDPENGLSCVDPRLDEHMFPNALMFARSDNCAASPSSYQKYSIPLK